MPSGTGAVSAWGGIRLTGVGDGRVRCLFRQAGGRVQDQGGVVAPAEVEQAGQWSGEDVEGAVPDAPELPVVLDEPDDGGLVGPGVVDVVHPAPRGDEEER